MGEKYSLRANLVHGLFCTALELRMVFMSLDVKTLPALPDVKLFKLLKTLPLDPESLKYLLSGSSEKVC